MDGDDFVVVYLLFLDQMYWVGIDCYVGVMVVIGIGGMIDDDVGIGGDGIVFIDDQWVEVYFYDLWQFVDYFGDVD